MRSFAGSDWVACVRSVAKHLSICASILVPAPTGDHLLAETLNFVEKKAILFHDEFGGDIGRVERVLIG